MILVAYLVARDGRSVSFPAKHVRDSQIADNELVEGKIDGDSDQVCTAITRNGGRSGRDAASKTHGHGRERV